MSPTRRRLEKINSLLQAQIADIMRQEMKDPRLGFASVIRVETSGDLRHARVRVSVLGTEDEKKRTLETLRGAAAFVREQLLGRLDLRWVPSLEFELDENIAYSIHISRTLEKINRPPENGHD